MDMIIHTIMGAIMDMSMDTGTRAIPMITTATPTTPLTASFS
jgi:hypothetical protein